MGNFFRVATVILLGAAGVYIYEMTGGEIAPAPPPDKKVAQKTAPVKAVAVSRSPPARIKSRRSVDRSKPMPPRPPGLEKMIEARGGSDFPILIPQYLTKSEAVAKNYNVRLKLSDDGYTSVLTLPDYDVVIYGTRSAFRKPSALQAEEEASLSRQADDTGRMDEPIHTPVRTDYDMTFEDTDDGRGGSLSFGRYGVDYHIEFYCRDAAEGCIDEAAASAFLTRIFAKEKKEEKKKPRLRIEIGVGIGGSDRDDKPDTPQEEPNP